MTRPTLLLPIAVLIIGGGIAYANDDGDVFTGCLTPGGDLKNVQIGTQPTSDCKGNSTEVSWNATGSPGPSGVSGWEVVEVFRTVHAGDIEGIVAWCPDGKVVTGGGFDIGTDVVVDENEVFQPGVFVQAWWVRVENPSAHDSTARATAVCVDAAT